MNKSWKLPLYLLLFGILTVVAVFFKNFGSRTYTTEEIKGSDNGNLQLFVQPEAGREPIVSAINGASSEILVEVYLLSDKEVIDALISAKERGVKVQIMMEQHPFGGGNVNVSTAQRLGQEGVEFKWANPTFALTHEKTITIDRREVFILNQNLTKTAFERNREYDIEDMNAADVAEVASIFEADWNRSGYAPVASDLVISPDNSRGKLTALVNSATKSLDLELEIIADRDMIKLLGVRGEGLAVRIIVPDFGKVPSNREAAEKLKAAGVQVRTLSSPYVHAKMIMADGVRAYVGSVNLSDASMDLNREVGILISQADIIQKIAETFEQDWNNAIEI